MNPNQVICCKSITSFYSVSVAYFQLFLTSKGLQGYATFYDTPNVTSVSTTGKTAEQAVKDFQTVLDANMFVFNVIFPGDLSIVCLLHQVQWNIEFWLLYKQDHFSLSSSAGHPRRSKVCADFQITSLITHKSSKSAISWLQTIILPVVCCCLTTHRHRRIHLRSTCWLTERIH